MNAITNFDFEGQGVRVVKVDDAPWFVGLDVCRVLEIEKHHQALGRLDGDERGTCSVGTPSGDQQMIVISEPGVYRLVFASRKPAAERFKRWLAHEVLPALRKTGSYVMPGRARPIRRRFKGDMHPGEVLAWSAAAREARHIYGRSGAKQIWDASPLPKVQGGTALTTHLGRWTGEDALHHLFGLDIGGGTLGELVQAAISDRPKRRDLEDYGVRLIDQGDGLRLFVADDHAFLREGFEETEICYAWNDWLRKLPGAHRTTKPLMLDGKMRRGVLVPVPAGDEER